MKKVILAVLFVFAIGILLAACSDDDQDQTVEYDVSRENSAEDGGFTVETEEAEIGRDAAQDDADSGQASEVPENMEAAQQDRKIIYTADMRVEVKNYRDSLRSIQNSISEFGGYVVESTMNEETETGSTSGHITARIPQEQFEDFIELVEEGSDNVLDSSVSGQDITEEYIDLESRLKSKEVVEERLLSFMEQAEETEDLLAISDDLANVQEEIEEITGRMNYLQDKSDLATVTIHIQERDVSISGVGEGDLNTWEKTQEQFMRSINFLISAFSGIFIFLVGNLPLILLLGVIGLIVFWVVRKQRNRKA